MTVEENWEENTAGISIHGDGIPVLGVGKAGTRSLDVFSIQSLFSSGPTVEVKILLYWLFADTESEDTRLEIWRMLCWSFYYLSKGKWPDRDWYGRKWDDESAAARSRSGSDLAGGFRAVLYAIKGDLDFFA